MKRANTDGRVEAAGGIAKERTITRRRVQWRNCRSSVFECLIYEGVP